VLELPFCGKANSLPDGLCDMDTVLAYFDTITPDDVAEVLRVRSVGGQKGEAILLT
jgi:hypothetical protein